MGPPVIIETQMQRYPKKTQYTQRAFTLPSNFGQTARSFPHPLFSSGKKPLKCRLQGQKGQTCNSQRAAWAWEVSPQFPYGELEYEEGREPWGEHRRLSLPNSCTGIQVKWNFCSQLLFLYLHHSTQLCKSLRLYCSDHTGKKPAVLLNEVLWGCICVVQRIFLTFLSLPSCSTQQFTADECC